MALTVFNGVLTIRSGGTWEGLDVRGCIEILTSAPVTLRNVKVSGPGGGPDGCNGQVSNDRASHAGSSLLLDHVTSLCSDGRGHGFWVNHVMAIAVKTIGCENGFELNEESIVRRSFISAREANSSGHGDGIQSQGGDNVVVEGNTLLETNPVTSAIITNLNQNRGWKVRGNFMGGGAYTLYCPQNDRTGWEVSGNRFVRAKTAGGAAYGISSWCGGLAAWSGNRYDNDGAEVSSSA